MIRTRQTENKLTSLEKFALGEAYYYAIEDNSKHITKTALKVLLLIEATVKVKSYPFRLKANPWESFWCYDTNLKGIRELVRLRYLERPTRETYKITDSGIELVKTFWYNHSRRFAKSVNDKLV